MEKWILDKEKMPDFDGDYLCNISQLQPCGNVWNYYKVVNCKNNEWNIEIDEIVLSWKKLPTSPEFENIDRFNLINTLKGLVSDVDTLLSDDGIEWQQAGYFNHAKQLLISYEND